MAQLDGKQLRNQSTSVDKLSGTGIVTFTAATVSFGTGAKITTLDSNILSGTDVVNKNYVDSVAAGLDPKQPVQAVALSPITLSGTGSVVDGWTLSVGNRVLVNGQAGLSATATNGVYVVSGGAWSRATDSDGTPSSEISTGNFVFVHEGTNYAHSGWVLTNTNASNPSGILAGTDSQLWVQFSEQTNILAGDGLSYTGQNLNVNVGSGITISSDAVVVDYNKVGQVMGGAGLTVSGNTLDVQTTNGLSIVSDAVALGGQLSQYTDIDLNGQYFQISDGVGGSSLQWNADLDITLASNNGDITLGSPNITTLNGNTVSIAGTDIVDISSLGDLNLSSIGSVDISSSTLEISTGPITTTSSTVTTYVSATMGNLSENGIYNTVNNGSINNSIITNGYIQNITETGAYGVINRAKNGGVYNQVFLGGNSATSSRVELTAVGSAITNNGSNNVMVLTDTIHNKGAVYASDYSANFTPESLVSKRYVDSIAGAAGDISGVTAGAGLSGGGTQGFVTLDVNTSNGLSIVSDAVVLGGTLSQNTTISNTTYTFGMTSSVDIAFRSFDVNGVASKVQAATSSASIEVEGIAGDNSSIKLFQDKQVVGDGSIDNSLVVKDGRSNKGLVYESDYSPNFSTYSLVTKGYVDSVVTSTGLTAQNGLTETSTNVVELGGTLLQNTTIYADSYDFNITNASTLLSDGATVSIHGQKEASMYSGNWGASASYFTLRPDVLIVEVDDGFGGGAQLWVESPNVQVPYAVSDGASASIKIVDSYYQKGLVYVDDYTANFTNNSLVTKQYVDNKVGLTSGTPVYSQRNLTPVVTSGNGASSSLTLTSTPKDSTNISVYVNGSLQYLGNGVTTGDCYFGTQSGTAVAITSLISGYTLFWNGTNAGFDLSTTDRVDIVYNS